MAGLGDTTAAMARMKRAAAEYAAQSGAVIADSDGPKLRPTTGFGADPGELKMLVYAPPGLGPGAPLVVALHGCTQTAQGYAAGAGWMELSERLGFVLLCPEQSASNNAQRCFNWFEPGDIARGGGEAASIRAMIEHAIALHRLDRRRVFVTGLSAGAAMAAVLLATYPEVFAGGAIVAGLPFGVAHGVQEALAAMFQARPRSANDLGARVRAASPHRGPWPRVSVWHGDADHTVQPLNLEESVKQWTDLHGLSGASARVEKVGRDLRRSWAGADGQVLVESHTIAGLGHGVPLATGDPDAIGVAGPFLLEAGVSSSLEIARFWGLVEAAPHVASTHLAAASEPTRAKAAPAPDAARPHGVEAVIHKALKAAGLLKTD